MHDPWMYVWDVLAVVFLLLVVWWAMWDMRQLERQLARQRAATERRINDDLMDRVIVSKVRAELLPRALSAHCDVVLATRPVPSRLANVVMLPAPRTTNEPVWS